MNRGGGLKHAWHRALARFFRQLGDTHRHFGNLHGNRDEQWHAIANYTRAIELDPGYTLAYFSRGVLYWREVGDHERAVKDLTRTLELDPSWAEAYFNRALAYRSLYELDQASADLERYLAEGQDEYWLESARHQLTELQAGADAAEPGA